MITNHEIQSLLEVLFPINRSLTGDGNRKTLEILSSIVPLNIYEVPSGTECFDWKVPEEWRVNSAKLTSPSGEIIADFSKNNLHLLGYSIPFNGKLTLEELKPHLFTLPDQPNAIPYVTSYYNRKWGFCIAHESYLKLDEGLYTVEIDTELFNGSLTYADLVIPGKSDEEILISTYICHPSMANNELSGPIVSIYLAKMLLEMGSLEKTIRFVFIPETIGSIVYLSKNFEHLKRKVSSGYVLTCIGDAGNFSYLQSRLGNSVTDRITIKVLKDKQIEPKIYSFLKRGSDERNFNSPLVNLGLGSLMRSKYTTFPEYHTSLDNLDFVNGENLLESINLVYDCVLALIKNNTFISTVVGEPMLGKRGLYRTTSIKSDFGRNVLLDTLAFCDGQLDLFDIADKAELHYLDVINSAEILLQNNLIKLVK